MEQLDQLKTMRDEALARLQANPDYRLLTSLDQIIVDLEMVVDSPRIGLSVVEPTPGSETSVDEVIEQMSAELESATDDDIDEDRISFNG